MAAQLTGGAELDDVRLPDYFDRAPLRVQDDTDEDGTPIADRADQQEPAGHGETVDGDPQQSVELQVAVNVAATPPCCR